MNKRDKGKGFEEIACEYLKKKGLIFVEKNFEAKTGEIDLIFRDKDCFVFVEVKSGNKNADFDPLEHITLSKIRKWKKTVEYYLLIKRIKTDIRLDAVGIRYTASGYEIEHIIDVVGWNEVY